MWFGGAVFDPVRRVVIENSGNANGGRDIFVTRLSEDGSGTNEVLRGLLPFDSMCKPIFGSERFVYFQQESGTKFGRVNLDTMAFEMLPDSPYLFGQTNGFFMDGSVFCFAYGNRAVRYDCAGSVWSDTTLYLNGKSMVPHPWHNGRVIELLEDGRVREVRVADTRVCRTYASKYGNTLWSTPEMLALCAPSGEFLLAVYGDRNGQPWRVFSSAADTWTDTSWKIPTSLSSTLFLDPTTTSLFYHVGDEKHWTMQPLQETPRTPMKEPPEKRHKPMTLNPCEAWMSRSGQLLISNCEPMQTLC